MTLSILPAAARRTALAAIALLAAVAAVLVMSPGDAHAATAGHHASAHHHTRAYEHARHPKRHHGKAHHAKAQSQHRATAYRAQRPGTAQERSIADAVLKMLNDERAANHLPALTMDAHLITSAHAHDLAMARTNTMSHQVSGESDLGTRITRAGYQWTWAGENVGWNSEMDKDGVLELEQIMYDEKPPNDGHRQNILCTHFKNIGVDVYMDHAHGKVWLTTDFGRH